MARDRAIQLAHEQGWAPPTLRLYRWSRPTVTLGRFQAVDMVDLEFCRAKGIDVVRRFTGGRGVLHDDEVTYSVVAGVREGLPRGVAESYRFLCRGLVDTFHGLGVEAQLTASDRPATTTGACYLQATRADVSAGVLKLSGSAQVWHGETVLQHGSFVRRRDPELEARIFALTPQQTEDLSGKTATLATLLDAAPPPNAIVKAAVAGFSAVYGEDIERGTVSEAERTLEMSLVPQTDPAWRSRVDVGG